VLSSDAFGRAIGLASVTSGLLVRLASDDPRAGSNRRGDPAAVIGIIVVQRRATSYRPSVNYLLAGAVTTALAIAGLRFGVRIFGRESILRLEVRPGPGFARASARFRSVPALPRAATPYITVWLFQTALSWTDLTEPIGGRGGFLFLAWTFPSFHDVPRVSSAPIGPRGAWS